MKLFEVTNGWMGEAYNRCYVWAADKTDALRLAEAAFHQSALRQNKSLPEQHDARYPEEYWKELECRELFDQSAAPFATVPSDSGWNPGP